MMVSRDCFGMISGILKFHAALWPLPAFLVSRNHERKDTNGQCRADQYFSHNRSSILAPYSPGAVTLRTFGFHPIKTLAQRTATRILFRLSLTQWTLFGQYFGTITSGANLAVHKIALPLVNCPRGLLCPHFGCQRKGWAERRSPNSEISIRPVASGGERECRYINVGL